MIIKSIKLKNYRKFDDATLRFNSKFNILIGKNGSGKTTALDAIATLLGTWFQGSKIPVHGGNIKFEDCHFSLGDIAGEIFREVADDVFLEGVCIAQHREITWRRDYGDRGKKSRDFIRHGNATRSAVKKDSPTALPVLLYYGAGRLWNIHRNIETSAPSRQIDAYKFCLDPHSDQKSFERWFKRMAQSQIQRGTQLPALAVVENAVISCTPGAKRFYFDVGMDEILIELDEEGLIPFNSLSDGFRNMCAMVADIAHRAFRLNPNHMEKAALLAEGIVLIDEIDLHLHPKWQRRVVDDLQTAFPKIQFIVTTHSPFILQAAKGDEVIDVNGDSSRRYLEDIKGDFAFPPPAEGVENKSIEDIAELVMGIEMPQRSARFQEMFDVAQRYYSLLEKDVSGSREEKDALKERLDELSAPFSENVAYHAFLQMKRIASGVTSIEEEE